MGTRSAGPVERFHPTVGRVLGVVGAVALSLGALLTAFAGSTWAAAAAVAGMAWGALVVYVALIRPTVHAYDDHLLLRNMLRDTEVPWHLVDDVAVRQTTQVYVDDEVHHGIGVGRSARQMVRSVHRERFDRSGGFLGLGGVRDLSDRPTLEHAASTAMSYPDYVEIRLLELAKERGPGSTGRHRVERHWVPVETAGLAVLGVIFVLLVVIA